MITNVLVCKHACSERTNELYMENVKTNVFFTKMAFKTEENETNWFLFDILKIFESQLER